MFLGIDAVVSFHLWHYGVYDGWDNLRYGFFQVLSFISTSGFASTSMESWPEFDKLCPVFYWLLSAAVSDRPQGDSRSCALWCCLK